MSKRSNSPKKPSEDRPKLREPLSRPPAPQAESEIVHVPRGSSRFKFVFTLALTIFVLVIFTVGDQMVSSVGGPTPGQEAYMSWQHPTRGQQELSGGDFVEFKRQVQSWYYAQGLRAPREALSNEQVAYMLITDVIAQDAGIEVTDSELADAIRSGAPQQRSRGFGNKEVYLASLQQADVSPATFEQTLRSMMRVWRYEDLLSGVAQPDPSELEKMWKEQHQEFSFDVVSLATASFLDAAAGEVPSDEDLASWYEQLPDKRTRFNAEWLPERVSAEIVSYPFGGIFPAKGLIGAHPRPPETDSDQLARAYYDRFSATRFRIEDSDGDDSAEDEGEDGDAAVQPLEAQAIRAFEEVVAKSKQEANIHASLIDWLAALRKRLAAGDELDIGVEAASLGLDYRIVEDARTQAQWLEAEGAPIGLAIVNASRADSLVADVVVTEDEMIIARVIERQPAGAPPFADVRDKVVEEWTKERAQELATEKLDTLHGMLAAVTSPGSGGDDEADAATDEPTDDELVVVDEVTFQSTVQGQGLGSVRQDWFDPRATRASDAEQDPPELAFLRTQYSSTGGLFGMDDGQVSSPTVDWGRENMWLVRKVGKRDPVELDLSPRDLDSLKRTASFMAQSAMLQEVLTPEAYVKRYGLRFAEDSQRDAEASEETPEG